MLTGLNARMRKGVREIGFAWQEQGACLPFGVAFKKAREKGRPSKGEKNKCRGQKCVGKNKRLVRLCRGVYRTLNGGDFELKNTEKQWGGHQSGIEAVECEVLSRVKTNLKN